MSFEKALNRFTLLSGLSDEEALKWLPVVKDAIVYIESLVTKKDLTERDKTRLSSSAGVYAYYRYLCYSIDDEDNVTLGSLHLSANQRKIEEAEKMWQTELKTLSDLFRNDSFIFRRM
ncbi:MAG: hypothetical protein J1E96_07410 [Ruminococcus sp.]|nr:hypothetical protein [Ruminococcus sp.]